MRNILGIENTRYRYGPSTRTFLPTNSPHKTERLAEQDSKTLSPESNQDLQATNDDV